MPPPAIMDRISLIDKYLHDAMVIANMPGGPVLEIYFYEDFTDVLDLLHRCIRDMLSGSSGPSIVLPCGTVVGLAPFYDMLDELDSLEDTVDELDELPRVLVDFLHAGNVSDYKACRDTVEQLTLLMRGIYIHLLRK